MYPGKALPAESESSQNKPLVKGIVSKALAWTTQLCAVPGTASASKEVKGRCREGAYQHLGLNFKGPSQSKVPVRTFFLV